MSRKPKAVAPFHSPRNIETIAQVEQALLRRRSWRGADGGKRRPVLRQSALYRRPYLFLHRLDHHQHRRLPESAPFDPYPFAFLSLIVGIEFIFLTTFVLLNQKHQIRREEQWSHLHLQLSMLTEQEVTQNVQMLSAICRRLGIHDAMSDKELRKSWRCRLCRRVCGEIEKSRDSGLAARRDSPARMEEKARRAIGQQPRAMPRVQPDLLTAAALAGKWQMWLPVDRR